MITTRPNCSRKLYDFIGDLMRMIPNSYYYPRGNLMVNQIATFARNKAFTHLMVLSEKDKVCNGILLTHLGANGIGPTAFFKVCALYDHQHCLFNSPLPSGNKL